MPADLPDLPDLPDRHPAAPYASTAAVSSVVVHGEQGTLYGELVQLPASPGIVVLVHSALLAPGSQPHGILRAQTLHDAGLSTLDVGLLSHQEIHFPDAHNNVPLLARRLVEFLDILRTRMQLDELREQPVGLLAAEATTPVAIRVAALRDHDIAALVCHNGLVDLAGALYLRSLAAPLLLLVDAGESQILASNRRALAMLSCRNELRLVATAGGGYGAPMPAPDAGDIDAGKPVHGAFDPDETRAATAWFLKHFTDPLR